MAMWEQRVARARRLLVDGDQAAAERELRAVRADGDFDAAVHATYLLGELLDERDDAEGAENAFQQVIDSAHPIYAQTAAISLGLMNYGADDLSAAQAVLRIAADGPDPDVAGRADALLAQVLHLRGDEVGAREALKSALTCNDPDVVELTRTLALPDPADRSTSEYLRAAYQHAGRLLNEGRDHDAEPILWRLLDSGHPHFGSLGAVKLYWLHVDDAATARRMAERIIEYRHPEHLGRGYALLGGVLAEQGDLAGAAEAFRGAVGDPHPDVRLHALINLGMQLRELGRPEQARDAYEQVIATRHPRFSAEALGVLAELLRDSGDVDGAVEAFRKVVDSGHPEKAPMAAYNVGVLLYEQGDTAGAVEAFRVAADAEDPHVAHQAGLALSMMDEPEEPEEPAGPGDLMARARAAAAAGDLDVARAAYRQVIEAGAGEWQVPAATALGLLEAVGGQAGRARQALRWAAVSEDERLAPEAAFRHALLDEPDAGPVLQALFELDNGDETALRGLTGDLAAVIRAAELIASDESAAIELLADLAESPNLLAATRAGHLLACGLIRRQRHEEAIALLDRIVGKGHQALLPWSASTLGDLLLDRSDIEGAITALEAAAATGHPPVLGESFGKLSLIYRTWGRHDDLLDLYRRTAAAGPPDVGARAAFLLGEEYVEAGEPESALELFTRAAAASSAAAPVAAFGMRAIRQEFESARASFLALTDDDRPHYTATRLCLNLAHHYQSGEFAEWALSLVAEAGHPDLVRQGWLFLGALRNGSGDTDGAIEAWRQAAEGADPDEVVSVAAEVGNQLGRNENETSARAFFRTVAGHDGLAAQAQIALGELVERQGARAEALAWYRRASRTVASAGVRLARLLAGLRDPEGAKSACRHAISTGDGVAVVDAGLLLGHLHHVDGELGEARESWDSAEETAETPGQFAEAVRRHIARVGETGDAATELARRADPATAR